MAALAAPWRLEHFFNGLLAHSSPVERIRRSRDGEETLAQGRSPFRRGRCLARVEPLP